MEQPTDIQKISHALSWIISLLNQQRVAYQVVGGLAAQAYGATRSLVDIDLYISLDTAQGALQTMRPYLIRAPLPHRSNSWDLVYLALEYKDMLIEIGDSSTNPRFYNRCDQRWEPQIIDYTASYLINLYGVDVAVMPKDELIRYKTMLDREVDHLDIQQITKIT